MSPLKVSVPDKHWIWRNHDIFQTQLLSWRGICRLQKDHRPMRTGTQAQRSNLCSDKNHEKAKGPAFPEVEVTFLNGVQNSTLGQQALYTSSRQHRWLRPLLMQKAKDQQAFSSYMHGCPTDTSSGCLLVIYSVLHQHFVGWGGPFHACILLSPVFLLWFFLDVHIAELAGVLGLQYFLRLRMLHEAAQRSQGATGAFLGSPLVLTCQIRMN